MRGVLYAAPGTDAAALEGLAREFSPRIDVCSAREIALDLSGLSRLFGTARAMAEELRRQAADRGLRVRVAMAGTHVAARLLARHRAGISVIEPGTEATALAALPLGLLAELDSELSGDRGQGEGGRAVSGMRGKSPSRQVSVPVSSSLSTGTALPPAPSPLPSDLATLHRWGLRTMGEFAALPPDEVAARLGQRGVQWQRLARGEDPRPLVPAVPEERFEQALDLEWPVEGLEPLSFVLGRLCEPLAAHLVQRDRGAAVLHVRLSLVKPPGSEDTPVYERSLELPAPIRDPRTLRTLALLDLESNPPPAAVERVVVAVDPTPARVLQFSLLTRPLPTPDQLSTLMARLTALMGDGRCGAAVDVDSWQPGAFAMKPFLPGFGIRDPGFDRQSAFEPRVPSPEPRVASLALRRFRNPVPARVRVDEGHPVYVTPAMADRAGLAGGRVVQYAGPWRTSGQWWNASSPASRGPSAESRGPGSEPRLAAWDRDEWDIALAGGAVWRVFRERESDRWFVEGVFD